MRRTMLREPQAGRAGEQNARITTAVRAASAMAVAAETPITPPELTVEATVTARWIFVRP